MRRRDRRQESIEDAQRVVAVAARGIAVQDVGSTLGMLNMLDECTHTVHDETGDKSSGSGGGKVERVVLGKEEKGKEERRDERRKRVVWSDISTLQPNNMPLFGQNVCVGTENLWGWNLGNIPQTTNRGTNMPDLGMRSRISKCKP